MSVPKQPKKNFVDTKKGDKQFLEPSGMEPKFINKKVSAIHYPGLGGCQLSNFLISVRQKPLNLHSQISYISGTDFLAHVNSNMFIS